MQTLIGITGTTSVGKSAVAVHLAKRLHTEIVSADSMQIYKGMDIGTAKISVADMQGVTHHMLDIVVPNEEYSSFLYREQAADIINKIDGIPIVVGGTGFYFESLVYPPEFGNATSDRRNELLDIYEQHGIDVLQRMLKKIDSDAFEKVDINNYKRVIRAIEIAEGGGSITNGNTRKNPRYNLILFVLQRNRQELYKQIDARVDKMINDGLVDEVRTLVSTYGVCDTPAFEAIGYKEIIRYLSGDCSLTEAISQIKLHTRHYAKRQISYYKRMDVAAYIDVDGQTVENVSDCIVENLKKHKN